jgi:hypothetical protein
VTFCGTRSSRAQSLYVPHHRPLSPVRGRNLNVEPSSAGVKDGIPIIIPRAPTKHEEELYKALLPDSVLLGGTGVDLRKMQGLWDAAVEKNVRLPQPQQKQLRRTTIMALDGLRERITVRDNQRWSAEPIREEDEGLRQVIMAVWVMCW